MNKSPHVLQAVRMSTLVASTGQQCPGQGTTSLWSAQNWDPLENSGLGRTIQLLVGGLTISLSFWVFFPRAGVWSEREH